MTNIRDIIDLRPAKYPEYYDNADHCISYSEYFIKGTNMKLGFKCEMIDTDEGIRTDFYCIVCDGYDMMDPYDTEDALMEHFEWMLMNKELIWRYYT